MVRFLILGAGPAGLSFACSLYKKGITDFLIIEKEAEPAGLCRSTLVDGAPFDIGGGHFLDVRKRAVKEFLFEYMPEKEWNLYARDSRIEINANIISSPIEANIWQMDMEEQIAYLKAIATAGCSLGTPMPEKFVDWIYWKLGSRIAEDYMIPYNTKMFGEDLNRLGTYWLDKLPNVSLDDTLRSCLSRCAYGKQPAHAMFYYPKAYGYSEVWNRMADSIGDRILFNTEVDSLDVAARTVNGKYSADCIVNTTPWTSIKKITGAEASVKKSLTRLKHTSVVTEYHPENKDTEAHWIYYPSLKLPYHRVLVRHNFCAKSNGYWTETNLSRYKKRDKNRFFINEYAYPLNTIEKPEAIRNILDCMKRHKIIGLGRWGEWQHYNSDVVVERSIQLAERISQEAGSR